jgi:hypothetical protein
MLNLVARTVTIDISVWPLNNVYNCDFEFMLFEWREDGHIIGGNM